MAQRCGRGAGEPLQTSTDCLCCLLLLLQPATACYCLLPSHAVGYDLLLQKGELLEEAEEHLSSTMAELHAIRIASSETDASRGKLAEVEAAATVMTEKLSIQLASAQKEAESVRAKAAVEVEHLTAKLKQVKKLASKERHAQQQTEAFRARQLEALKHEATRLRHEREQLKRQVREGRLAVGGGGGGGAVAGGGGAFGGELKRLLVAETALVEEASALKLQAAGITA